MKIELKKYFISIKWWFTKLLLFIHLSVSGQLLQNHRLEIPISSNNESYEITSANTSGIILSRGVQTDAGYQLEIIHTDTAFQEKWKGYLPIDRGYQLIRQVATQEYLYLVFFDSDFSDRNFQLFEVALTTGTYNKFIIRNHIPFIPTMLEATNQAVLIGGYFNRVPLVLFFQLSTLKSKVLPGLFNEAGELTQVKIHANNSFDILISAKNYQRQQTLWLKNYSPDGSLIRNVMLQPEGNNSLIFGRTLQAKDGNQIIAGVYGNRHNDYSRGIFVASIRDEQMQQIKYYNYADLENFFSYMRAKKEKRIKERIARKKIKGKKIKFQYRFIVHELVSYKNQFILLGEAFYPHYRHVNSGYSPGQSVMIFDGYQYTHAVVLGVDPNGNLLWDNSFEINDVKTFSIEQFVKMDTHTDKIALLYLYDNKIRTKLIQDRRVLEGKSFNSLNLQFDENLSTEDKADINRLDYWYDDYFLAYGVQTITSSSAKRKKVFFINKVHYQ